MRNFATALLVLAVGPLTALAAPDGGPAAPDAAKTVAPTVGSSQLITNPQDDAHRPRLPAKYNRPGMVVWGLYKICVDSAGAVASVNVIKSADTAELDEEWMKVVRTWRYRPYLVNGSAVPFCYPLRLQVSAGAPTPRMLSPSAGSELMLNDGQIDPRKIRLPAQQKVWGIYKVCVNSSGAVAKVSVVKSTGDADIDESWMTRMRAWRYRPYLHEGVVTPFCYPVRASVPDLD